MKKNIRCLYLKDCYLAEELQCYGFRTDCPLYMKSNGEPCNDARFDAAMDRLIAATRDKHARMNGEDISSTEPQSTRESTEAK